MRNQLQLLLWWLWKRAKKSFWEREWGKWWITTLVLCNGSFISSHLICSDYIEFKKSKRVLITWYTNFQFGLRMKLEYCLLESFRHTQLLCFPLERPLSANKIHFSLPRAKGNWHSLFPFGFTYGEFRPSPMWHQNKHQITFYIIFGVKYFSNVTPKPTPKWCFE